MNVMNKLKLTALLAIAPLVVNASGSHKHDHSHDHEPKHGFKTQEEKVSYCIGQFIGERFAKDDFKMNMEVFIKSLKDAAAGKPSMMSKQEMQQVMMLHSQEQRKKMEEKSKLQEKKGKDYLKMNKLKPGVKTTASGLQYKVIRDGKGAKPKATDRVKTHYTGKLIDGTVFDSSVDRGEPTTFGLNQVIKGWTEALQLMSIGSKWELTIPSELAYGANPRPGGPIGPNETLIFEIELIEIVK